MTKQLSVYGTLYDDAEPLYLTTEQGVRVWDRVEDRWLNWASLAALAVAKGHTWQPREVGIPSLAWQEANWNGQRYAPGLDDTSGLSSEAVVNGEVWTGATGATPPTSWTATGTVDFTLNGEWLTITATDEVTFAQTLTTVESSYYVLEAAIGGLTTGNVTVTVDDITALVGEGGDGAFNAVSKCGSFMALAATTDLTFTIPAGGVLELKWVRVFLESELTGAGVTPGTVDPEPQPDYEVLGPYMAGGMSYFVQKFRPELNKECMIWLDVDSDPEPDLPVTKAQVCDSAIDDDIKVGISARLVTLGCEPLPCMVAIKKNRKENKDLYDD